MKYGTDMYGAQKTFPLAQPAALHVCCETVWHSISDTYKTRTLILSFWYPQDSITFVDFSSSTNNRSKFKLWFDQIA